VTDDRGLAFLYPTCSATLRVRCRATHDRARSTARSEPVYPAGQTVRVGMRPPVEFRGRVTTRDGDGVEGGEVGATRGGIVVANSEIDTAGEYHLTFGTDPDVRNSIRWAGPDGTGSADLGLFVAESGCVDVVLDPLNSR
jgi:hypothetical protein